MTYTPAQESSLSSAIGVPSETFYYELGQEALAEAEATVDALFTAQDWLVDGSDPTGPPTVDDVRFRLVHMILSKQGPSGWLGTGSVRQLNLVRQA